MDEQILVSPLTELRNRYSSYIFGASLDRRLLFHPLLPGNVLKDVLVTDFETDGVITGLLDTAQNRYDVITKSIVRYIRSRFANGYCSRVGGKVRGWAKLCTCLMDNVWLITWRSFTNRAYYAFKPTSYSNQYIKILLVCLSVCV